MTWLQWQYARLKETSMQLVITADTHGKQNLIVDACPKVVYLFAPACW